MSASSQGKFWRHRQHRLVAVFGSVAVMLALDSMWAGRPSR